MILKNCLQTVRIYPVSKLCFKVVEEFLGNTSVFHFQSFRLNVLQSNEGVCASVCVCVSM